MVIATVPDSAADRSMCRLCCAAAVCPQVSALEAQVRELQLVGEKRLLSVQQEADAAARQARLAHQQEVTALQVGAAALVHALMCVCCTTLSACLAGNRVLLVAALLAPAPSATVDDGGMHWLVTVGFVRTDKQQWLQPHGRRINRHGWTCCTQSQPSELSILSLSVQMVIHCRLVICLQSKLAGEQRRCSELTAELAEVEGPLVDQLHSYTDLLRPLLPVLMPAE
jgi:multidrug efflux pump subunit AcrA (membrane-fusion protein)